MTEQLTKTSDLQLLKQLQAKDRNAYEIFYSRYSAVMYKTISLHALNEQDTSDVFSESFVNIWKNMDNFDGLEESFLIWVLSICRKTAIEKKASKLHSNTTLKPEHVAVPPHLPRQSTSCNIAIIG